MIMIAPASLVHRGKIGEREEVENLVSGSLKSTTLENSGEIVA
jgi:hypothetical protein